MRKVRRLCASKSNRSYKFLHKDYIGSILAISDEAGNKLEQQHFDAWRNFTHLQVGNGAIITDKDAILSMSNNLIIDRGYTSHEHFMEVGIIHMNGRLYDPLLRRFLNADENIQDPTTTPNTDYTGMIANRATMLMDDAKYMNFINDRFKVGYPALANKKGLFIYLTPFLSPSAGGASYTTPLTSKHIILFKSNLDHLASYSHESGHTLGLEHFFLDGTMTVNQEIASVQAKLNREKAAKASHFVTNAAYYTTHPAEKIKNETIYNTNIKNYEDQLAVLKKNTHKFIKQTTENIMDYNLSKQITFDKWQWKVIQEEAKTYYH